MRRKRMKPTPTSEIMASGTHSLGRYDETVINRVLYGDLRDSWQALADDEDTHPSLAFFLRLSKPPLPVVTSGFEVRNRQMWLFARDRARVDEPTKGRGLRELRIEPVPDVLERMVAESARAESAWIVAMFPWKWTRDESGLSGEPLTPEERPTVTFKFTGTSWRMKSTIGTVPDLDSPVAMIEAFIDRWWGWALGEESSAR